MCVFWVPSVEKAVRADAAPRLVPGGPAWTTQSDCVAPGSLSRLSRSFPPSSARNDGSALATEVPGLRARTGRALQHGEMKEVCSWCGKAYPPDRLKALLPTPIHEDLRLLAETFVELQRRRHEADYDPEAAFVQSDIMKLLESIDEAFACWKRTAYTPEAEVFLVALAFGKRWDR